MTTNRSYTEVPTTATPDVPYWVNQALVQVDADVEGLDVRVTAGIASANASATTKANNAEANAKAYADTKDVATLNSAKADATAKADTAEANAKADATAKYGGLPARVTSVEEKNTQQDTRLNGLEALRPTKSVRLENGTWVWGLEAATHYVLLDNTGAPAVRATPFPTPNPTKPELNW